MSKPKKTAPPKPQDLATGKPEANVSVLLWLAAIAAQDAADAKMESWEFRQAAVARFLVCRAEDPAGLAAAFAARTDAWSDLKLPKPAGFKNWATKAADLWQRVQLRTDYEGITEGARLLVSPYHLKIAVDPKHPLFDRRAKRATPTDLVESIREFGAVKDPIHVSVWPEDEELALYVVDGRQRVGAVKRVNHELLVAYVEEALNCETAKEVDRVALPAVIRVLKAEVYVDDRRSQVVNAIGNQCRLAENILGLSAKAAQLQTLGYDLRAIGSLLGVSMNTVSNFLRLQKLAPTLRPELEAERLAATTAYLLAGHPHKTQLAAWKAVQGIAKAAERAKAIEVYLRTGKLPAAGVPAARPVPAARILEAAGLLSTATDEALQPYAVLLAALAGDAAAHAKLPEGVRTALAPRRTLVTEVAAAPGPGPAQPAEPPATDATDTRQQPLWDEALALREGVRARANEVADAGTVDVVDRLDEAQRKGRRGQRGARPELAEAAPEGRTELADPPPEAA